MLVVEYDSMEGYHNIFKIGENGQNTDRQLSVKLPGSRLVVIS